MFGKQDRRLSSLMLPLLVTLATSSQASQMVTYTYDAQGRLVAVASTGTVNNGVSTSITYDPAGNRSSYTVSGVGGVGTPTPTPSGTITATNPTLDVASSSSTAIPITTLATLNGESGVIASFSPPSGGGTAVISQGGQSVTYNAPYVPRAPICEDGYVYTYTVPYSIRDSGTGAIANGSATINVQGPAGPRPKNGQYCP